MFAFIHARAQNIDHLFGQLREAGHPTFAYVRGASEKLLGEIACDTIRATADPIDLTRIMEGCDAVICNGGHSTIAVALMAGRPLMLVPQLIEQALMAYRLQQAGLAITIGSNFQPGRFRSVLDQILTGSPQKEKAAEFAEKYKDFDMALNVAAISERCEQIIA